MDAQDRKALAHLRRDRRMRTLIARIGPPRFHEYSCEDLLHNLLEAVIAQQLSGRVARVIFERFRALAPRRFPEPARLLKLSDAALSGAGLSRAKIACVRDLCGRLAEGRLRLEALDGMEDEEVVETLSEVRGIGPWTAHMVLIFAMRRPDVWPVGDLALRKSLHTLLRLDQPPSPGQAQILGEPWRPWRSYACWYLWQMNDG